MKKITGFVAYPSSPYQLTNCIKDSITLANNTGGCLYTGWEENDIKKGQKRKKGTEGLKIDQPHQVVKK